MNDAPKMDKQQRQQKYFEASMDRCIDATGLLDEYGPLVVETLRASAVDRPTAEVGGDTVELSVVADDIEHWLTVDPRKEFTRE